MLVFFSYRGKELSFFYGRWVRLNARAQNLPQTKLNYE